MQIIIMLDRSVDGSGGGGGGGLVYLPTGLSICNICMCVEIGVGRLRWDATRQQSSCTVYTHLHSRDLFTAYSLDIHLCLYSHYIHICLLIIMHCTSHSSIVRVERSPMNEAYQTVHAGHSLTKCKGVRYNARSVVYSKSHVKLPWLVVITNHPSFSSQLPNLKKKKEIENWGTFELWTLAKCECCMEVGI